MTDPARHALNRMVVGQGSAVISLSRLIDMHFAWFDMKDPQHRSPNALIIGPTGSGKTHAIRVATNALKIPCLVVDSTRLVTTGTSNSLTLEEVLQLLVMKARSLHRDGSAEDAAAKGIVFLDEFDKLRFDKQTDDTAGVQRRLLQFIEGDTLDLERSERQKSRPVDTQGILFIAAGAFTNIDKMKAQRPIGSGSDPLGPEDVQRYGFLEELAARLPIIIRFNPLGVDELREILERDEVSPLRFYKEYFQRHGYQLELGDETKEEIAKAASNSKLGARGLHQELFPVLNALADQLLTQTVEDPRAPVLGVFELSPAIRRQLKSGTYRLSPGHVRPIEEPQ